MTSTKREKYCYYGTSDRYSMDSKVCQPTGVQNATIHICTTIKGKPYWKDTEKKCVSC